MARLTKNNKRSIKSTWREINWHVEGSAGGAAAGTGWGSLPQPPPHPLGHPPVLQQGPLSPYLDGRCWRVPMRLPQAQHGSTGAAAAGGCRVPWEAAGAPLATIDATSGTWTPKNAMGTSLLCQPGQQPGMAQPPRRAAPALPAERGDVPKGQRGGDMGTPGIGGGALSHALGMPWLLLQHTEVIYEPQAGSTACTDTY